MITQTICNFLVPAPSLPELTCQKVNLRIIPFRHSLGLRIIPSFPSYYFTSPVKQPLWASPQNVAQDVGAVGEDFLALCLVQFRFGFLGQLRVGGPVLPVENLHLQDGHVVKHHRQRDMEVGRLIPRREREEGALSFASWNEIMPRFERELDVSTWGFPIIDDIGHSFFDFLNDNLRTMNFKEQVGLHVYQETIFRYTYLFQPCPVCV